MIFWGCGFDNYISDNELMHIDSTNLFKVGIRDFDNPNFLYVPCASCMSPLFDLYKDVHYENKYILYLHDAYSKIIHHDLTTLPCMFNHQVKNLEEAVKFLASGQVILTNSFHGLYWGTLLGRKVIVLPWVDKKGNVGFSNKFTSVKYKPCYCLDWKNYLEYEDKVKEYPESLDDSRKANIDFCKSLETILPKK